MPPPAWLSLLLPKPPGAAHRAWRMRLAPALLHGSAGNPSVTWIGHATILGRLGDPAEAAEMVALFAEGRADVFPAGDLAVQVQAGRLFLDGARPSERALRALADGWRPHRGTAALFLWHCYNAPPL